MGKRPISPIVDHVQSRFKSERVFRNTRCHALVKIYANRLLKELELRLGPAEQWPPDGSTKQECRQMRIKERRELRKKRRGGRPPLKTHKCSLCDCYFEDRTERHNHQKNCKRK